MQEETPEKQMHFGILIHINQNIKAKPTETNQ